MKLPLLIAWLVYEAVLHNSCIAECCLRRIIRYRWQNIAVKLLTGLYAYSPEGVCRTSKECRNSLELAVHNLEHVLDFMGELSSVGPDL